MSENKIIRKASGDKEPFSKEKFESSLRRAGAGSKLIEKIYDRIHPWLKDGVSTGDIYKKAFGLLRSEKRSLAARYSLKKAIMELGPEGFVFERFMGLLLQMYGYKTTNGVQVQGHCVYHEVDVLAEKDLVQCFIECKYFNSQDKYANVQIPLYIQSRFLDIAKQQGSVPGQENFSFEGWIVTNTRFTSDALEFGNCVGLRLLSWDFPHGKSLKDMVEHKNAFPVTALTQLNRSQKKQLTGAGIVLCLQIAENHEILNNLELSEPKKIKVIEEIEELLFSANA